MDEGYVSFCGTQRSNALILIPFLDAATADLNEELQLLAGVVPSTFWQVSALKRTYYPTNPEQNPVQLNGIVVFVNGALSYDGRDVTNALIFYIGVRNFFNPQYIMSYFTPSDLFPSSPTNPIGKNGSPKAGVFSCPGSQCELIFDILVCRNA